MGRINNVSCGGNDGCGRLMTFHSEVEDGVQFYRCHNHSDKWAIAFLNNSGGISSIKNTNWNSVNNTKFLAEMTVIARKAIRGK